ncbi:MAG TPA: lipid-A-disaccharide synthase [Gemmatimonadaceae bacterium]|nr:lipid-A-disaccharide synthase [Gemmatimonadaceae bacterium]
MGDEVLMVAGETSGDLHAAAVAAEIRSRDPALRMVGIGGSRMAESGVELIQHSDALAVMGIVEVVRHVPLHARLLRELRRRMQSGTVGLVVLVDYPGFNMRVARAARAAGVPVLYYITPQVWAWGAGRLAALRDTVTRAAVILPFEESLLREHGIDATFVGHPLLDQAAHMRPRADARRALGIPEDARVLALFPGSRAQELARHLDLFVQTARLLEARMPDLRVMVSVAPGLEVDARRCPYPLVRGASFDVWRAADAAFAKSGTSTLEAAVADCPLVIGYRTSPWTYRIARHLVRVPDIGLVNVVAGRRIAPEFVQDALRPGDVAEALAPLLDRDGDAGARMREGFRDVREALGAPGAAARVATLALEMRR